MESREVDLDAESKMMDTRGQGNQGKVIVNQQITSSSYMEGVMVCYHAMWWLHRHISSVPLLYVMVIDNNSILPRTKRRDCKFSL